MKKIFISIILIKLTQSSCWLHSYGRGVGKPISKCPSNKDKNGPICYDKCKTGYKGVGPVCWQGCPGGFKDIGALCLKPKAYGRGAGYALWDKGKCKKKHRQGCEKNGLLYYPKCKKGFHNFGCCICTPNCVNDQKDIGVSCVKKSYTRGLGSILKCDSNSEKDGLFCYKKCSAGYNGIGPVCWNKCPSGKIKCGLMCVDKKIECTNEILTVTFSVLVAVGAAASIPATGGASAIIAPAVVAAGSSGTTAVSLTKEICEPNIKKSKSFNPVSVACKKGTEWTKINGSGVNISVLTKNMSYHTNKNDNIYKRNGKSWRRLSENAKDIGVGANGKVWIVGTNKEKGGYGIYKEKKKEVGIKFLEVL